MLHPYNLAMTPDQFERAAFDFARTQINALMDAGKLPEDVGSFAELHDYLDANCLAGFGEEWLQPTFEAIYPRTVDEEESIFSDAFNDAVGRIQGRLDSWIRGIDGMRYQRAFAKAIAREFSAAEISAARSQLQNHPAQSSFWLSPCGVEALVMRGRGLLGSGTQ